jgi:hypothetical protein
MLDCITSLTDPRTSIIKDDPVRPNIAIEQRINDRACIYLWTEDSKILAAVCVSLCDAVPESEISMLMPVDGEKTVAVAYTIWSYSNGAARKLIFAVRDQLPQSIKKMVTLSPQTEMARRFHQSNGAVLIRENADTWNFEYNIAKA